MSVRFAMFSFWGYLSVLLWLAAMVLFVVHFLRRPRRWLCHYAVLAALVALVVATLNSRLHVNRLQVDPREAMAAVQARQDEARRMAVEARAGDVAPIRFAEDGRNDFLDMAGLDDEDRRHIERMTEDVVPAWRREKRTRSTTRAVDDSLEAQLDTPQAAVGVDAGALSEPLRKSVVLPENAVMLARRLDGLNRKWLRWLLLAGLGLVVLDYLQRVNRSGEAYLPLPLPSSLVNGLTPQPVVCDLPLSHRRSPVGELEWLVRRGDTFVFLTTNAAAANAIPEHMARLPCGLHAFDVLRVAADDRLLDDAFLFEALWYRRAAFVIDSAIRAESFLASLCERLRERRQTRARVAQTVHVVWNLDVPMADRLTEESIRLMGEAGFSLRELTM